jgi:Skp family chaperone for outer membrane proteins
MPESSQDFVLRLVGYALAFVGPTGVLAWLQHRQSARAAPVTLELAAAQAERERATAEQLRRQTERAEREERIAELRERVGELKAELKDLQRERSAERTSQKLLELQLEREVRWRKANNWPEPPEG